MKSTGNRKIAVVVTSRASYARIKTLLRALHSMSDIELQIIAGASMLLERMGEPYKVVENDGLTITERVYMVVEGENPVTMAKTVGIGIIELATIFDNLKPDIVVSVADRYETIATAIAATYLNIPVAHVQGGEVTGSIDEKVRHSVSKMASLHFVSNDRAAQRVQQMGENPEYIFVTGCPSIDLAKEVQHLPLLTSEELYTKYGGVGAVVPVEEPYIVVMQHPVTTEYEEAYEQMWETLMAIHTLKFPTFLFWPNLDAGSDKIAKAIRIYREQYKPDYIHFFKNLAPEDFLRLFNQAAVIVGNSSVAIREGSFLGVPAVNIGTRQQGRDKGPNVRDVSYDREAIVEAIRAQWEHGRYAPNFLYGRGDAGQRIAKVLEEIENIPVDKMFMSGTTPAEFLADTIGK